jgi:hypothetical protein
LCNQAEGFFKDDNNTPTNQQAKQQLDQTRFTFVVYLCCSGSLGRDKQVESNGSKNNIKLC